MLFVFTFIYLSLIGYLTMAGNLTDEQRKWVLKQHWKTENGERVREQWIKTFSTCHTFSTPQTSHLFQLNIWKAFKNLLKSLGYQS